MSDYTCRYVACYQSKPCGAETAEWRGFCAKHTGVKCSCGKQATNECNYEGQLVCGVPLCDDCHGYNKPNEPSGSWGFLNHYHGPKSAPLGERGGEG